MRRTLDRLESFDPKSRDYPIRELISLSGLRNKTWVSPTYLNQNQEGSCIGHAWAHELASAPRMVKVESDTAKVIYYAAQQFDEWPGVEYSGTSVLAGAKVVKAMGHMPEYRWAFGIDDLLSALAHYGPVVLGIPWYSGMFTPDPDGFLSVSGEVAGGHAILATGVQVRVRCGFRWEYLSEPIIRLHNSWGEGYGVGGDAFIMASDLARLLAEGGEACVPVIRR